MTNNYAEKFEKMRIAGKLASKTLDMITDYIKPGISTNNIDKICYEFIKDNGDILLLFIIEDTLNHFVLL